MYFSRDFAVFPSVYPCCRCPMPDARCPMPDAYVFPHGFLCISAWFSMYFRMVFYVFSHVFNVFFGFFCRISACLPMHAADARCPMRDAAIYTCVRFPSIFGCFLCISAWFSMYFRMFSM
jgi:hypothetical protein